MKRWNKKGNVLMWLVITIIIIVIFIAIGRPFYDKVFNQADEKSGCMGTTGTCKAVCDVGEIEPPTSELVNTTGKLCPPKNNSSLTKCCIKT